MSTQARQKATFTATLIISHVSLTQAGEAVCNKSQTFHQTNRPNTSAKTQVKTKKNASMAFTLIIKTKKAKTAFKFPCK